MPISGDDSPQSLIPNFLYTSSVSPILNHNNFRRISHPPKLNHSTTLLPSTSPTNQHNRFMIPAPDEPDFMYSRGFYVLCSLGIYTCGIPRMMFAPIDRMKCIMQIHPDKWMHIMLGTQIFQEGGRGFIFVGQHPVRGLILVQQHLARGLFTNTGWFPTLVGHSVHGACKFGFYDFFKKHYSDIVGPEFAAKNKTLICLAGAVSAEAIATVALCPFEAVKVRVQTQPGFARGLEDGLPKLIRSEGTLGLYKGLVPLWGRQIPYTMMQFAAFERIEETLYKYYIHTPKNECSRDLKTTVSVAAGYVTGVLCTIVSHPADTLFSLLNNSKGATVKEVVKKVGVSGVFTRGLLLRMVINGTLIGFGFPQEKPFHQSVSPSHDQKLPCWL